MLHIGVKKDLLMIKRTSVTLLNQTSAFVHTLSTFTVVKATLETVEYVPYMY